RIVHRPHAAQQHAGVLKRIVPLEMLVVPVAEHAEPEGGRGQPRRKGEVPQQPQQKRSSRQWALTAVFVHHANRVKPSALQSSLPTPWCTKNRPSGSYFALMPRKRG